MCNLQFTDLDIKDPGCSQQYQAEFLRQFNDRMLNLLIDEAFTIDIIAYNKERPFIHKEIPYVYQVQYSAHHTTGKYFFNSDIEPDFKNSQV